MKEGFSSRLLRIRTKFGASQDEIAPHYGVKMGIYQKYESGKEEPKKTALRKWILRMDHLEKLQTLPPLNYEQSPKNIKVITSNSVPSTVEDLRNKLSEKEIQIEAMWDYIATLNLTIKLLSDKAGIDLQKFKNMPTKTM